MNMIEQDRSEGGKFDLKSKTKRAMRSFRSTDDTWNVIKDKADEHDMNVADYFEALCSGEIEWQSDETEADENDSVLEEVAEVLRNGLAVSRKGNITKQLVAVIEEALELMGEQR